MQKKLFSFFRFIQPNLPFSFIKSLDISSSLVLFCLCLWFVFVCFMEMGCKSRSEKNDWQMYKADAASTSYSALKKVNKKNVSQLTTSWTFRPNDAAKGSWWGAECNPIVVDGVMYAASYRHRIYALNASNGQKIWSFDPFNGGRGGGQCRGVVYWKDGNDKRILFTAGDHLFALNAQTGKPISSFGEDGKVSLNVGMRDDAKTISIVPTSPGIVYQDLLILGTEVSELYGGQPGYERAYNIKTGKLVWTFHTIPLPGEPGYETWPKNAYKYAGGANDWGGMSLDKKRGMVFLALGSPSYDSYGANRIGKDLFGNCVVALNAKTGKLIWYFQTVHHDIWDYDLPAPPNLVTVEKDGKKIDAVAQISKTGFLYVLNRETGKSLFPIEERKVPASDVPGEKTWPTQPFPLKPQPYSRHIMTEQDLSDYSPADHDSLIKSFHALRYEGMFTPPSIRGSINLPGTIGGAEWGGAAYDPATGVMYIKSNNAPEISTLHKIQAEEKSSQQSDYDQGKALYLTYCAGCHGTDRKGSDTYPSLIDLQKKMTKEAALEQVKMGGGKMPAFANIVKGHEKAIIDYLFQIKRRGNPQEADLNEIKNNELAQKEIEKVDTLPRYLNVTAYHRFGDPEGNPGIKPPWGVLNAINLNTGEYEWKVPVGNIPKLQKKGAPPTGMGSSQGPIVTAGGLIFMAGTRDRKFRAYDKDNGKLLWETTLPGVGSSTPSTYMCNGKQYIVISVSANKENPAGCIVAFSVSK